MYRAIPVRIIQNLLSTIKTILICLLALLPILLLGCGITSNIESSPTPISPTLTPNFTYMTTSTPTADWKLVWSDEFNLPDGSPIDNSKWSFNIGSGGWGNGELQYYTDRLDNARIENAELVIKVLKEDFKGSRYTSARLVTRGKGDWTYGRFEIKAKLPYGQGIWPAIWMLPTDSEYGGWPRSGEIDIIELKGYEPWTVYGTLHYGNPHEHQGRTYSLGKGQSFADDFHLFALEWEPGEMRWYVDGFIYQTLNRWFTSSTKGGFPAPFDKPFHLIMNVAVGGGFAGLPDETTLFPQEMRLDYIRVYAR